MKYSLYPGRFQPFHNGHEAFVRKLLAEGKSVCIALRDTPLSDTDPYSLEDRYNEICKRFDSEMIEHRVIVGIIPDIEEIVYGRGVGYGIRQIEMPKEIEAISATKIREALDVTEQTKELHEEA